MLPFLRRSLVLLVVLSPFAPGSGAVSTAGAQEPPRRAERQRAEPGAPGRHGARSVEERRALEQRFRESLGRLVQRELGLSDAQTERLGRVNQQFDARRRQLVQQELEARRVLRVELQRDRAADDQRVGRALDDLLQVQRRRLELQVQEQRELAQFLTPVQRARYLALQENVRRRVDAQRGRQRIGAGRPDGAS